ncbi:hypothetical protein HOLleu_34479 [Holothuria leucospilota]|uniref:arylamine N-acetyltransferase n=1 Tax=Holothuria leucospilota TaxID=206669 RepID=A0A9Q1BFD4_HOLLE|nr:hypothetical protein HOLleu_34479 [Holothuria leucospilota]
MLANSYCFSTSLVATHSLLYIMSRHTNSDDASSRRLSQMLRMTSATENGRHSQIQDSTSSTTTSIPDKQASENMDLFYPLTRDEALSFVENKLHIPDPEAFFRNNKQHFLNHLVERLNQVIPFTNMHFFTSTPFCNLTSEDYKQHIFSDLGGICIWINPFTKALLEQLGYKAYHVCGNNPGDTRNDTHISTIACDVSYPGSRHLVDPGTRRPLCAAIPLDFEKESPAYKFHFMKSKFFWREGDILVWCAQSSQRVPESQVMYDSNGEKWQIQVTYWLKEKTTWHRYRGLWQKFGNVSPQTFRHPFNGLVFFAYLKDQIVSILGFKDNIAVIFYKEDSYRKVHMTRTELMNFFQKHYPQYPARMLQEVFQSCQLQ